ncbi:MAG TPA: AF1514 family protein [Gallionellaceae bacterium]|nr:AF1514 family protein [Gallionellaceae bacterium]HQS73605.1 AF1514 family protein [Gallionellaceae bacterium]
MKDINVSLSGININYKMASQIALATANVINDKEFIVVAWHDKAMARMSPVIEGGHPHSLARLWGKPRRATGS